MKPQVFKTRRDVERYFSGDTIECLICGRHFKRLPRHLAAKHSLSADHYKKQFGLAWTRGLTSATSLAKSGWTEERKAPPPRVGAANRYSARLDCRK
jgi:predicted transcriptional regulator